MAKIPFRPVVRHAMISGLETVSYRPGGGEDEDVGTGMDCIRNEQIRGTVNGEQFRDGV